MNIEKALKETTDLTPKEFIEKAVEGGYNMHPNNAKITNLKIGEVKKDNAFGNTTLIEVSFTNESGISLRHWQRLSNILLDPLSWEAVGKAMGWEEDLLYTIIRKGSEISKISWKQKMHQFIDNLIKQNND